MKQTQVWRDFEALPPTAQQQVLDFIAFLQTRYAPPVRKTTKRPPLTQEPFIGMWRGRADMQDSTVWVRETRKREWKAM